MNSVLSLHYIFSKLEPAQNPVVQHSVNNVKYDAAMSNTRPACGPVKVFVRLSLGFRCSISRLQSDKLSLFW